MKAQTQVDAELAQAERRHAADPQRAELITRTRRFKSSWFELAEALTSCQKSQAYTKWGYSSFEDYYRKELRLKAATVAKLVGSYAFLRKQAPEVLQRDGIVEPIPSPETIDYLRRAAELGQEGQISGELVEEIRTAVLDDFASAAALAKKFSPVLYPSDESAKKRRDAIRTAAQLSRRLEELRGVLADPALSQAQAAIELLLAVLGGDPEETPPPASPAAPAAAERPAAPGRPAKPSREPDRARRPLAAQAAPVEGGVIAAQPARTDHRVLDAHRSAVVYLCSLEQSSDASVLRRMRKALQWKLGVLSDANLRELAALFPAAQWLQLLKVAQDDPPLRRQIDRAFSQSGSTAEPLAVLVSGAAITRTARQPGYSPPAAA